jgi:hypothetical protein
VTFPGPTGAAWALALPAWALAVALVGEVVRGWTARAVPWWAGSDPIERGLLDLYLGGAVLYLVAALPLGAFGLVAVAGLPLVAAVVLVVRAVTARHRGTAGSVGRFLAPLGRPWALVAVASAVALYAIELVPALSTGTGNTYDSSLLTTYVALLLHHGTIPLSFRPYESAMILYPQGTTVWLGSAQLTFGLPPARTSLLVTPLFLALEPLAGYALGRRLLGRETAGAAFALALAWLGPGTRGWVGGSNDFVLAAPLVLLLAAQLGTWTGPTVPTWGDAVGFGMLAGYSAALNPVGAEWLLPALLVAAALARPAFAGAVGRWLLRWASAVAASLVGILPTLYVLLLGLHSPGFVPGAPSASASAPTGISVAQFLGSIDPFLFRTGDIELSPVPLLRLELALLLVLGVAALLLAERSSTWDRRMAPLRRWALAVGVAVVALLALLTASSVPGSPVRAVSYVTNGSELSASLFVVFGLLAAVPLAWAFDRLDEPSRGTPPPAPRHAAPPPGRERWTRPLLVPLAVALVIVVPGVVLTPTQLGPVLSELYGDFGHVSSDDFALLAYAGEHLPSGSRVLVAPGSSAEFLPGYATSIVLLYPMEPGLPYVNASYALLVRELTNGTLDAQGQGALTALDVGYVAVTGANTVLWPPFSAAPLLGNASEFVPLFHEGDAYLFERT